MRPVTVCCRASSNCARMAGACHGTCGRFGTQHSDLPLVWSVLVNQNLHDMCACRRVPIGSNIGTAVEWAALNIGVLRADGTETRYGAVTECKGGENGRTPRKTRLPTASFSTTPHNACTCSTAATLRSGCCGCSARAPRPTHPWWRGAAVVGYPPPPTILPLDDHPLLLDQQGPPWRLSLDYSPPTEANRVRFPCGVAPAFSHVGIEPDDAAGQRQSRNERAGKPEIPEKTRRPAASSGTISAGIDTQLQ
ncbi:hypothetical protein PR048_021927 [Dryococelus australis]|uniref:Uncharacterized protein n=1 Tax=Dryococelus australis TaxID=614101 RepID=A0ABQ9GZK2_9NEOP|nr:hypothetical protein PR048_021927 [Dryococelus australis]